MVVFVDELMNRSLLAVNQQGYYASVEELFCQVPAAVYNAPMK